MTTTTKHGMPPMTPQELNWVIDGLGELAEALTEEADSGDVEDADLTYAEADDVAAFRRRLHSFATTRGIKLG